MWRAGLTVVGSVLVLAATAGAATPPVAEGGRCFGPATGTMHYSAGELGETRTFRATFRAHYECRTTDPTITSAEETGESTGWFNCLTLTGQESGTDHFSWDNGRTSALSYVDDIRYGLSEVRGRFVRGQFKHLEARFDGIVGANIVDLCATTEAGTSFLFYTGYGRFGTALE